LAVSLAVVGPGGVVQAQEVAPKPPSVDQAPAEPPKDPVLPLSNGAPAAAAAYTAAPTASAPANAPPDPPLPMADSPLPMGVSDLTEGGDDMPHLRLYGFMDAGLTRHMGDSPLLGFFPTSESSFVSGNANLYLDATAGSAWRALVEARFSHYPHGRESFDAMGRYRRDDTRLYDTTGPSGRGAVGWSGIILERSYIQWTPRDELGVSVGYFLSPYGIWNVDHGTPTLISLILPAFQTNEAMPTHQTGVQIFGTFALPPGDLGYTVYLSNGRTPGLMDTTDDKALGGRLTLRRLQPFALQLGLSGYYGRNEDISKRLDLSGRDFGAVADLLARWREWVAGADVSIDYRGLRLRSEGLIRRVRYEDGLHQPVTFGAPGRLQPSRYEHYLYGLLAYRFATYFEPYLFEEVTWSSPDITFSHVSHVASLGFNVYFTAYAMLKTQFAAAFFPDAPRYDFQSFSTRMIFVF
jgi:hypothetical protein